jgi:Bcr/CflA subfamily drug resistance transporter
MFFLIILLIILPPLAVDEYAASMPAMVTHLHTSISTMQLSIGVYLLAQGISQIFIGPISDRYGRKQPLLITLFIYLLGTGFCIFANEVDILLLGRFLQGVGMGCCAISAPAIISDIYKGEQFKKKSSYVVLVYSFIPIIAPVLGGYIQEWFGWRFNFGLLFLTAFFVIIIVYYFLRETHTPNKEHSLKIAQLTQNYYSLLKNPIFMTGVLTMALLWSIIIVFSVIAPFLLEKEIHLSPSHYGHTALFVGLMFLIGTLISRYIPARSELLYIKISLIMQATISFLMLVMATLFGTHFWLIIIPVQFIILFNGIAFPKLYALSLSTFPNLIGIASSLVGSVMLFGSVGVTTIIATLKLHSFLEMSSTYLILSTLCLALYIVILKENSTLKEEKIC